MGARARVCVPKLAASVTPAATALAAPTSSPFSFSGGIKKKGTAPSPLCRRNHKLRQILRRTEARAWPTHLANAITSVHCKTTHAEREPPWAFPVSQDSAVVSAVVSTAAASPSAAPSALLAQRAIAASAPTSTLAPQARLDPAVRPTMAHDPPLRHAYGAAGATRGSGARPALARAYPRLSRSHTVRRARGSNSLPDRAARQHRQLGKDAAAASAPVRTLQLATTQHAREPAGSKQLCTPHGLHSVGGFDSLDSRLQTQAPELT